MDDTKKKLIDFSLSSYGITEVNAEDVTDIIIKEENNGMSIRYRLPDGQELNEWASWDKLERLRIVTRNAVSDLLKQI